MFLYRKLPSTPAKAIVLEAPVFNATEASMDEWLKAYLAALDQVDAETDNGEPGRYLNESSFSASCINTHTHTKRQNVKNNLPCSSCNPAINHHSLCLY